MTLSLCNFRSCSRAEMVDAKALSARSFSVVKRSFVVANSCLRDCNSLLLSQISLSARA